MCQECFTEVWIKSKIEVKRLKNPIKSYNVLFRTGNYEPLAFTVCFPVRVGIMPKHVMEIVIHINERWLIPRDIITLERKLRLKQREWQLDNQKEKVKQIRKTCVSIDFNDTVVTIKYTYNELQSYEEWVANMVSSSKFSPKYQTTSELQRLVEYGEVKMMQ